MKHLISTKVLGQVTWLHQEWRLWKNESQRIKDILQTSVQKTESKAMSLRKSRKLHQTVKTAPSKPDWKSCRLLLPMLQQKTEEKEYIQYLQELKEACNLRSLKVKSSSEFQLLILGHLNATLGKETHEHLPKHVGRFLPEENSRIGELMTGMITELKLHQQWFL